MGNCWGEQRRGEPGCGEMGCKLHFRILYLGDTLLQERF